MFERISQIIILVLLLSLLVLVQFSFISAIPDPFRECNLVLIVLTFTIFFLDLRVALIAAMISGLLLDLMSFYFFGFHIFLFFISLLLAQSILKNWLTNRSFYTLLALMLSITIFYNLFGAAILYLINSNRAVFFLFESRFWVTLAYQCAWSFLAALILFNLAALVSKRIKPFFLEKKSFI